MLGHLFYMNPEERVRRGKRTDSQAMVSAFSCSTTLLTLTTFFLLLLLFFFHYTPFNQNQLIIPSWSSFSVTNKSTPDISSTNISINTTLRNITITNFTNPQLAQVSLYSFLSTSVNSSAKHSSVVVKKVL